MPLTASDIAKWMLRSLNEHGILYQVDAIDKIRQEFGDEFIYENDNGNLAISKVVLKAFASLTDDSVVWERGERCWRLRKAYDEPGRQQD